jgi:hypothetical protein
MSLTLGTVTVLPAANDITSYAVVGSPNYGRTNYVYSNPTITFVPSTSTLSVSGNVYVSNRIGFYNSSGASAAYQVYNSTNNSIDFVFA